MIGSFLYSTFPFLRLELIATIKSPSIFAVESSLGRSPVNNAIAQAMRKFDLVKRAKSCFSSSLDIWCFLSYSVL